MLQTVLALSAASTQDPQTEGEQMFRSLTIAATIMALIVAAPALAKERPPQHDASVAVQGSSEGIAPSAPEAVRERIAKLFAGTEAARATQHVRRSTWIGCRTVYAWRGYNNPVGMSLFRYYQQVSWCSNGFGIYSWSRDRWPEISGPGWRFDGHIGSTLGGSSTQKNAWTQGS
ncbi:MAG: hypothetical protein ACXWYO_10480, partial [Gaiellaceae bacterium]